MFAHWADGPQVRGSTIPVQGSLAFLMASSITPGERGGLSVTKGWESMFLRVCMEVGCVRKRQTDRMCRQMDVWVLVNRNWDPMCGPSAWLHPGVESPG